MRASSLLFLAAAAGAGMVLAQQAGAAQLPAGIDTSDANFSGDWPSVSWDGDYDQAPDMFDSAAIALDPSTYAPVNVNSNTAGANQRAFLDLIATAEGTYNAGDDGYRMLFGGNLFDGFADHPRIRVPFRDTYSTAAGRYQILARTWDGLQGKLNLPDFSPASQDLAALELINERGALGDVQAGRVAVAVGKCAKVWASFPGAGYSQPERRMSYLISAFQRNGGTLA